MGVNEAMACGVPVMASKQVGCVADLVLENRTGIAFGLDDADKCVDFLRWLCNDRMTLNEMSVCASSLIAFFSFSHIVDSVARTMYEPAFEPRRRSLLNAAL